MSLTKTLNKGKQKKKIPISDIRENPDNLYDFNDDEISALALSIAEHGQLHNAVVYEEELDDGKHYTLLSGAKRYRAITKLHEGDLHDGLMDVLVQDKPENQHEMKDIIGDANLQRRPTHETLYKEIKEKEEYYNYLVKSGKRPELHKRDYIGSALGITGRQVTNILNEFEKKPDDSLTKEKSQRKEYNKTLQKIISKKYGYNTSITQKSITFKCFDTDELNELLEHFGIDITYDFEGERNELLEKNKKWSE